MLETVGQLHPGNNRTKKLQLQTLQSPWVVEATVEMEGMEGRAELVVMVATEGGAAMVV